MERPLSRAPILVVEDNTTTRKLVRVTLGRGGYDVLEAPDGKTAIGLVSHGDPAPRLILQDLVLPDVNGFELVRQFRRLPKGSEIPILAFTGFLTRQDEAQMMSAGFNGVLIKPIEPSRLLLEIEPYMALEPEKPSQRGPRILVVDDDPIQLKLARATLTRLGFHVQTAAGGVEALDKVRRERPDAVLSDVLMPDVDGFELCARLRADPATRDTPVLLITNHYVEEEDRRLAQRMGAQDLLVRTPDFAGAAERLRKVMGATPAPVTQLGDFSELQRAYLKRITTHLTRQVETNIGLSQRVSLLATSMSVLGTISRMLGSARQAERALQEVLAQCVDAAGLSRGALLLRPEPGNDWRCAAQVGFGGIPSSELGTLFGHTSVLERALAHGGAVALSNSDRDPMVQLMLARCGASSAILAEVEPSASERGVLFLVASTTDLGGDEWLGFAQTIAGQLGQALALGNAFQQIAQSEEQHRLLVDSVLEYSIIFLDPDGLVARWNSGAERVHGYTADAIIGKHISAFYTPEDLERDWPDELLRRAVEQGRAQDEGWRVRADGSRFWAETILSPVRAADGRLTGIAKVTRDDTERKRAEEMFRSAVDAAPNGMVMVDAMGEIVLANAQLAAMFGYTKDELIGKSIEDLLPERFRGSHLGFRRDFARHQVARPMGAGRDLFGRRKDGSEFPVEIGLNPVERDGERFVIASAIDITERKSAEIALSNREARVRALMENANDGIAVLSLDGIILETNRRWSEILGRPVDELIGHPISEFVASSDEIDRFDEGKRAGSTNVKGVRVRRSDSSIAVVDISQSTVDLGEQTVLFTIARDVTHEQMLERQLRQSQKMEAIGRLAGGIAHDFNNLLTAIQGNATFVLDALPPASETASDVKEILRAGERAAAMTRQLLAFSRQQVLSPRVLDLADLTRGTEKMLNRLIGEDIELTTSLDPRAGKVSADPGQIEQVVLNLVVNARDAMPRGGKITIEIRNAEIDAEHRQRHAPVRPGEYVMLAVSDTGIGMTEAVQARLFEPFFTTKEAGKGTGLGLSTVYGIVEQSGGFIWVYSEPEKGTTFKIYFPRYYGESEQPASAAAVAPAGGKETVLVAEDEALVRRLLVRSLERLGYTVLAATNPEEALGIAETLAEPVDLLVTDVVMPGLSGRVLAERLTERWPGLKVLFTSGYTDDAIVRHGILETGIAFLQKPYTPGTIAEKVREVLDQ